MPFRPRKLFDSGPAKKLPPRSTALLAPLLYGPTRALRRQRWCAASLTGQGAGLAAAARLMTSSAAGVGTIHQRTDSISDIGAVPARRRHTAPDVSSLYLGGETLPALSTSDQLGCITARGAKGGGGVPGYDVYVVSRTFREWGGGLYKSLPSVMLSALSDIGVCHFMVVVQDPASGASVQFDFGPPEGDVSSAMLSGVLCSTARARRGEIRETHRQARAGNACGLP